jgi:tryptophan-rich sensory protein
MISLQMTNAVTTAGICVLAAILEGAAAGSSFREQLAELRLPRLSPSLAVWVLVGIGYYIIAAIVLYRLLGLSSSFLRSAALLLVFTFLMMNALWNYVFFRRRNPGLSFKLGLAYSVLAVVLYVTLSRLDRVTGWVFVPYTLYLVYANLWTYRVWRLNESPIP